MLNKKQIKRLEDKLDRRSYRIELAYHAIERLEDNHLFGVPEEETEMAIKRNLDRIREYAIEMKTIKEVLSTLGYKAEPNTDETGIDHYSIERI